MKHDKWPQPDTVLVIMETTGFNLNDGLYFEKYEFEK